MLPGKLNRNFAFRCVPFLIMSTPLTDLSSAATLHRMSTMGYARGASNPRTFTGFILWVLLCLCYTRSPSSHS